MQSGASWGAALPVAVYPMHEEVAGGNPGSTDRSGRDRRELARESVAYRAAQVRVVHPRCDPVLGICAGAKETGI